MICMELTDPGSLASGYIAENKDCPPIAVASSTMDTRGARKGR